MAINTTPEQVKEFCGTSLPDSIIQLYIDSVDSQIGECLMATYDESTADLIALNLVSYFVCDSGVTGSITSERAPNGASTSFETPTVKDGLQSNAYGRTVYNLDTEGCWQSMITQSWSIGTVGNTSPPLPRNGGRRY